MKKIEIDHAGYVAKTKGMSIEELEYTRRDAKEALRAMPDGPKAGYYADEVSYCSMELSRRRAGGSN